MFLSTVWIKLVHHQLVHKMSCSHDSVSFSEEERAWSCICGWWSSGGGTTACRRIRGQNTEVMVWIRNAARSALSSSKVLHKKQLIYLLFHLFRLHLMPFSAHNPYLCSFSGFAGENWARYSHTLFTHTFVCDASFHFKAPAETTDEVDFSSQAPLRAQWIMTVTENTQKLWKKGGKGEWWHRFPSVNPGRIFTRISRHFLHASSLFCCHGDMW